ncbi:carbonic anhydrase [Granulicella mallensis]|uniref:Carbonic anhydrase n=1 Tax=Granulicella mallensis TaxID=940614 RepID=A0A7W8E8W9_9BACT|nr:carbonic anhydrase [Granulicella mallensis]
MSVTNILICGYSDCGAMTAISTSKCLDHLSAVANWLRDTESARIVNAARTYSFPEDRLNFLIHDNVVAQQQISKPIRRWLWP